MNQPSQSQILCVVARLAAGLIQLFALYVIFHGHYSPGGGFQGGALLAASILIMRMSAGKEASQSEFKTSLGTPLSAAGALLYASIGLVALIAGGHFLDYGFLPLTWLEPAKIRSWGVLFIELGVALAVMSTLISIFDDLANGGDDA